MVGLSWVSEEEGNLSLMWTQVMSCLTYSIQSSFYVFMKIQTKRTPRFYTIPNVIFSSFPHSCLRALFLIILFISIWSKGCPKILADSVILLNDGQLLKLIDV